MPGMGGGHSGGGHSGGGSHGGGGFHGGGSHGGGGFRGGGGFHGGPRGGGFHGGPPSHGPGPGWGWGWGRRRRYYGGGGCLMPFIVMGAMVFILFVYVISAIIGGITSRPSYTVPESSSVLYITDITPSTRERKPLDAQYCKPIDKYLSDEMQPSALGTAADEYAVINVLKDFYLQTGVQPYLWITDHLGENASPDYDAVEAAMYEKYAELFDDEGHLLVLYFLYEDDTYNTWYMWGNDAHEYVMDDEACEILLDYIDLNYERCSYYDENYDVKVNYAEMFCNAFTSAAHDIMSGVSDTPATTTDGRGEPAVSSKPGDGVLTPDTAPTVPTTPTDSGRRPCRLSVSGAVLIVVAVCAVTGILIFVIVRRSDESKYSGMSEEDVRKEKYRRKYGGK